MSDNIVITYGNAIINGKTLEKTTHHIQSIFVDNMEHTVSIAIRKGIMVECVKITMENAEQIGFINTSALLMYCKNI